MPNVSITFWGVRGVHPCSGSAYTQYGTHTICTEIFIEGGGIEPTSIIFDAGSGLAALGDQMMDRPPHRTLLFLSHVHLDHIMGIPFLKPLWHEEWLTELFCGGLKGLGGVETYLTTLFSPPLFPVPLSLFPGRKTFHDLMAGQILDFEGFQITTFPLNHPDTALGFRLDVAGKSIAYVTDTEHIPGTRDPHILKGVAGVNLMIYDSTYTDESWEEHKGWGHSTWQEAVRLAESAEVKKIALYHHCPEHPDASLEVIEKNIIALFPSSFVAREGQILKFTDL